MGDRIKEWLLRENKDDPSPEAYEYAHNHGCYRHMHFRARNRLTRKRLALDMYEQLHHPPLKNEIVLNFH